jgi:hypothetical protein
MNGYASGMKHIEVHVLESEEDIPTALNVGLLTLTDLDGDLHCSACSERVAHVNGVFHAFAIAIDEMDEPWIVCVGCVEPLLAPEDREVSSFEDLFIADEEFDDFDLEDDD